MTACTEPKKQFNREAILLLVAFVFFLSLPSTNSENVGLNFELNGDYNEVDINQQNGENDQPNVIDNEEIPNNETVIQQLIEQYQNLDKQIAQLQTEYNLLIEHQAQQLAKIEQLTSDLNQQKESFIANLTQQQTGFDERIQQQAQQQLNNKIQLGEQIAQQNRSLTTELDQREEKFRTAVEQLQNDNQQLNQELSNKLNEQEAEYKELNQNLTTDLDQREANFKAAVEFLENDIHQRNQEINNTINEQDTECKQLIQEQTQQLREIKNGCPGVTFHLPFDEQTTDYVRYRGYVQFMEEATLCAWIETADYTSRDTFFSYAVSGNFNEWFLMFLSSDTFRIAKGPTYFNYNIHQLTGIQKLHVCSWFSTKRQQIGLYFNAIKIEVKNVTVGNLNGGGTLILGQEQDRDFNLDPIQAFSGNITNLLIWPRILSEQEMSNIATKCECPQDIAVALTLDKVEFRGSAYYSLPDECPIL